MRTVTVFLSCPGDLERAKDELSAVVHEVARHFRPFDTHLDFWRHDPQAVPGVGPDAQVVVARQMPIYDIYVGLLCDRMGTPTARADSGTMEEFLDARQRHLHTGRPEILFYFCEDAQVGTDASKQAQRAKVTAFQAAYPGLFGTFHSVQALRDKFKDHLIDILLRQLRETPPPRQQPWLTPLAAMADALGGGAWGYLDSSPRFVGRIIEKLRGLVDLPSTLQPEEMDTLLVAAHLRALDRRGVPGDEVRQRLREVAGMSDELAIAAVEVAALAGLPPDDRYGEEMRLGEVRCHFVAALLQLAELLDLDHAGVSGGKPPGAPAEDAALPCWMAYHTRRIVVRRPGIVTFELLIARHADSEADRTALSRCAALGFEAEWHSRRRVLASHGVTVSRAPLSIVRSALVEPLSLGVRERMCDAGNRAAEALPELLHLNGPALTWPTLTALLPLPRSAVLDALQARWEPGRLCSLLVWTDDPNTPLASVAASRSGEASIPATALATRRASCTWQITEAFGGFSSTLAWGEVRALTPHERIRFGIADAGTDAERQRWMFAIGLWNGLLEELWPRVVERRASREEAQRIQQVLLSSYDWMQEHAPGSGRVDTIRNAAGLIRSVYLTDREGEFA